MEGAGAELALGGRHHHSPLTTRTNRKEQKPTSGLLAIAIQSPLTLPRRLIYVVYVVLAVLRVEVACFGLGVANLKPLPVGT